MILKIINNGDNLRYRRKFTGGEEYKLYVDDIIVVDDKYKYKHILRDNKMIMLSKNGYIRFFINEISDYDLGFSIYDLRYLEYAVDISFEFNRAFKLNKLLK